MSMCEKEKLGESFFNQFLVDYFERGEDDSHADFSYNDTMVKIALMYKQGVASDAVIARMRFGLTELIHKDLSEDDYYSQKYSDQQIRNIAGIAADNMIARAKVMSEMTDKSM